MLACRAVAARSLGLDKTSRRTNGRDPVAIADEVEMRGRRRLEAALVLDLNMSRGKRLRVESKESKVTLPDHITLVVRVVRAAGVPADAAQVVGDVLGEKSCRQDEER